MKTTSQIQTTSLEGKVLQAIAQSEEREIAEIEQGQAEMARENTWMELLETPNLTKASLLAKALRPRWDIGYVAIVTETSPESTDDDPRVRVLARSTFRTYRYGRNDWLVPLTDDQQIALSTFVAGWIAGWQAGRLG